jgi:hypothetical protein
MFRRTVFVLLAILSLLLLACVIDEDLRIDADGSGTYRARITIPKQLGEGFGDFRKEAENNGFVIEQEGQTEKERFLVIRKDFTDVTALNDSHTHYELTMTESGIMRRNYRLRASLNSVAFGSFKRRLTVVMPGNVTSTTAGEIDGGRVRWEGAGGGSLEIVSSGFYFPLSRNQKAASVMVILVGVLLSVVMRRRRRQPSAAPCSTCNSPLRTDSRFCAICGANNPVAEI